jgi:S-adenosylmethionine:tRNA ribosyltransferase-isomerase
MKRGDFSYELPEELIAQAPVSERDRARLLVVNPSQGSIQHHSISELPELLPPGTCCVPNDVKVRHARLFLRRSGGGEGEAFLLRAFEDGSFEAMVRPGARLRPGKVVDVVDPNTGHALATCSIEANLEEGLRRVRIRRDASDLDWDGVDQIGRLPLPPYIHHLASELDESRYQTAFHAPTGEAVAAPTAGLHFTPELITAMKTKGFGWHPVRLHVGLGTFRPMTAENLEDHVMHEERYEIPEDSAIPLERILRERGRPLMCIGTTALRTLEAAWDGEQLKRVGATNLFIQPGCRLRTADLLLTNFHLPESTLFVLVSALLGLDFAKAAYAEAVKERYRFFSYGDAMLILKARG